MNLETLRNVFSGRLLTEEADKAAFLTDWRGKWTGTAIAVAQPDTTADVAAVVRWCYAHGVPVVPQGGNTGLSGGATPDGSGRSLVLSLSRLNAIRSVDKYNNTLVAEAGVTLQQVQHTAREVDRLFPLSLAAEGSCTIGGNLATNAGGVQVLRYGNTRDLCLGLEVVTPSGDVWQGLRGLRKDNSGYDLRDLYIGSEGTLGVITAATLKLFSLPAAQAVALVSIPSPQAAVALLQIAQARLGSTLTAFELMSDECMNLVLKHIHSARVPLAERSPWYVLIEISESSDEVVANHAMEALLEIAMEQELVSDAALSANLTQFQALWALREDISEAQGAEGKTVKHDISLPISQIPTFIGEVSRLLTLTFDGIRLVVFGHLGDGNLHFNLSPSVDKLDAKSVSEFVAKEEAINRMVHDCVDEYGGSISAEHGLGVLRRDESARYKSNTELSLMRTLKSAFDPLNIMNPGKLLP